MRETSYNTATGFMPCPTCYGVGALTRRATGPMFAARDNITVMVDCPECHGASRVERNEADLAEERENFREFARTLPLLDDCAFTYEYMATYPGHEAVIGATCAMVRNGKCYEGHGSDVAAAYGRLVIAIVERES